jgi:hypothetical protein
MWMANSLVGGFSSIGLVYSVPPYRETSVPENQLLSIPVSLGSGPAYAAVQFGYSRNIGPNTTPGATTLYCTSRQETCQTDASLAPFAFLSESLTPVSTCASGCTLKINVVGNNIMYYRIGRGTSGGALIWGEVQAMAIP